jgi:hypothetical protein
LSFCIKSGTNVREKSDDLVNKTVKSVKWDDAHRQELCDALHTSRNEFESLFSDESRGSTSLMLGFVDILNTVTNLCLRKKYKSERYMDLLISVILIDMLDGLM